MRESGDEKKKRSFLPQDAAMLASANLDGYKEPSGDAAFHCDYLSPL